MFVFLLVVAGLDHLGDGNSSTDKAEGIGRSRVGAVSKQVRKAAWSIFKGLAAGPVEEALVLPVLIKE